MQEVKTEQQEVKNGERNICPITKKVWLSNKNHHNQLHYIDATALIRVNGTFYSELAKFLGLENIPTNPKTLILALVKKLKLDCDERIFITLHKQLEKFIENQTAKEEQQTAKADLSKVDLNKDLLNFISGQRKENVSYDDIRKILTKHNWNKQQIDNHFLAIGNNEQPSIPIMATIPKMATLPNIITEKF